MGLHGAAPFIPQYQGQGGGRLQDFTQRGTFLRPGTQGAVHIFGIAQHQTLHAVFGDELLNLSHHLILPAAVYHGGEAGQGLHAVGDGDTGMGVAIVNGHDFHRKNPFQAAQRLLFSYHTTTRWQVAIFP